MTVTSLFQDKVERKGICSLCGIQLVESVRVYGEEVCKRCSRDFVNRRTLAFLIDYILLLIVYPIWFVSLELAEAYDAWILAGYVAFPLKDGFSGYSPGKILLGVRAVTKSGRPIGFLLSFVRNMVLYIPFAPLIAAFQLPKGTRIGDGIADTRVVWTRHKSITSGLDGT